MQRLLVIYSEYITGDLFQACCNIITGTNMYTIVFITTFIAFKDISICHYYALYSIEPGHSKAHNTYQSYPLLKHHGFPFE